MKALAWIGASLVLAITTIVVASMILGELRYMTTGGFFADRNQAATEASEGTFRWAEGRDEYFERRLGDYVDPYAVFEGTLP